MGITLHRQPPSRTMFAMTVMVVMATGCADAPTTPEPQSNLAVISVPSGSGDRTAEINDSLAAASSGDTVSLAASTTYEFSGAIIVPSGVTLRGATKGTSTTPNLRATGSNAYVSLGWTDTEVQPGLSNLYIDGNNVSSTNGVQTDGSTNFRIDSVSVVGFGLAGINTGVTAGGVVTNCYLAYNGDAGIQISAGSTQISVTDCEVAYNQKNGIDINGSYIWAAYNDVHHNGQAGAGSSSDTNGIFVAATSTDITSVDIYDNTVYNNGRHGILIHGGDSTSVVSDTWVAGNEVYNHTASGGGAGIWVEGRLHLINGTDPTTVDTNVEYNHSHDNKWGFHSGSGTFGHDDNTSVTDNYFPNNTPKCAEYGSGVTASGNTKEGGASC